MGRLSLRARRPADDDAAERVVIPRQTTVLRPVTSLRPLGVLRVQPFRTPLLDRRGWRALRLDPAGLVAGTLFALVATTPSLLPRSWLFQAYVSGISGAIGYGIGVLLAWLFRRTAAHPWLIARLRRHLPHRIRRAAWPVLLVAVPLGLLVQLVIASDWQRQVRELVGLPEETSAGWLRALPVVIAVAAAIIAFFRGLRLLVRLVARLLGRWRLPRRLAQVIGLLVVTALTLGLFDGVALSWVHNFADTVSRASNEKVPPNVHQPQQPERSGSPVSLSSWDSLGWYGQKFVTAGPTRAQMAAAAAIPADSVLPPIRVYVGLKGHDSAAERAALAVAELDRTHAWDRAVISLVTTTGNGWVDYHTPEALELMYGGDVATVATQYSFLPSWLAFLWDRDEAVADAHAVFAAVSARISALPAGHRPKLLVYGESLGATASESVFTGLADIRARADGVLWVGPPHANRIWSELVTRRDPGSPEVAPVYSGGLVVRFGSRPGDWQLPEDPWLHPRVGYLMHATDPVVWWSPQLLFSRPDWLTEPHGDGVSPAMSWYPVITFWQLTADLANALYVPDGYGHNYSHELLDAWAQIAPPAGWTTADTARAHAAMG
jgi:uncharacterized membrane protein